MKRYDMFAVNDGHELQECAEGEWVRFEEHEQELRETAVELEKAHADVLTFTSRALLSEAALTEATALLERIVKYAREDRATTPGVTRLARALSEAERLLFRAPAQPDPEPTWQCVDCGLDCDAEPSVRTRADGKARCNDCESERRGMPAQPTAPTPVNLGSDFGVVPDIKPAAPTPEVIVTRKVWNRETQKLVPDLSYTGQATLLVTPAAPGPSAEHYKGLWEAECDRTLDALEKQRAAEAQLASMSMLHDEAVKLAGALNVKRHEAEATIAAVRDIVRKSCISDARADDAGRLARAIRSLLTPAPSPGAKEETK